MNYRNLLAYLFGIILTLVILFLPYLSFESKIKADDQSLRVLAYSSFLQKWGAGPEIAKLFLKETGIKIEWINAGNAGLLLERLKFKKKSDHPDIVVGFDQYSIHEAKKHFRWLEVSAQAIDKDHSLLPFQNHPQGFMPYDWGPLTFVYRKNKVIPPLRIQDLVHLDYKNKIILLDPRMSSPGLQFLFWIIHEMGEENAFEFLEKLKPSIKIMAPSWSSGYSLFKMQESTMVFSYYTSPFYHLIEEKNDEYQAVKFLTPLPVQIEYVGIPDFCHNCEGAKVFAQFLLKKEVQKILMKKNYMYPVLSDALTEGAFSLPKDLKFYDPMESIDFIKRKKELVRRWKKIFY